MIVQQSSTVDDSWRGNFNHEGNLGKTLARTCKFSFYIKKNLFIIAMKILGDFSAGYKTMRVIKMENMWWGKIQSIAMKSDEKKKNMSQNVDCIVPCYNVDKQPNNQRSSSYLFYNKFLGRCAIMSLKIMSFSNWGYVIVVIKSI